MTFVCDEEDERIARQAEPTAAWARRWKVVPGRLGNHPSAATYSGYAGYVREGWVPILDRLAEDLIALGWDRTLDQVKQKFGGLRFYIGNCGPPPSADVLASIDRRINEAMAESFRTCEECGAPARPAPVGGPGGWVETLCPSCFAAEDAEVRARLAAEEREQAEYDVQMEAEEDELAKNDPEYRAYLEEFVYPRRAEERRGRPLRPGEIAAALALRRCGVCRHDLSNETWVGESSETYQREGRCPRCGPLKVDEDEQAVFVDVQSESQAPVRFDLDRAETALARARKVVVRLDAHRVAGGGRCEVREPSGAQCDRECGHDGQHNAHGRESLAGPQERPGRER